MLKHTSLLIIACLCLVAAQWAQAKTAVPTSPITPGTIETAATFGHIGVVWWVDGDDDLDSQMTLDFRKQGDTNWQPGATAMRATPTIRVQDGPLNKNYWAASALFLEEGTTYDLRLTLTDPDGGSQTQTTSATTRTWPTPDPTGRTLYATPGSGGGDGSQGNPFQGLQAAAAAAQPGDTIHVAAGTYAPFQLFTSGTDGHPITFKGAGDGTAVIDGSNTDRGVVTLGEYNQTLGHIILIGLTIQNGKWGIDAQHTHNLYIHHDTIQDVDFGIYNRRADGVEQKQTVCDNTISGRTTWPGSGIPGERGIDLRGDGNVVCHNVVQYFGDCISLQPFTSSMSYGNDVYGNDAAYCVDDGIEIDYNYANVRVWRNRVMNTRMGVSVQPIQGGPAYIFRNEFFNQESVPIKMYNYTTGFIVAHNTGVKHGNGHGDNSAMWRNAIFRNNLFLGTRYAFEFTTTPDEGFRDFDYNAWGTSRAIGSLTNPFFKWHNTRYEHIGDLPAGVEDHGIAAEFNHLTNATLLADWDVDVTPGSRDLRLTSGVPEINAGTLLDNLNDPFTIAGTPDMGAFEYGQPLPSYGPRAETAVFTHSTHTASNSVPATGEDVTFTITLRNSGAPAAGSITMTDVLPPALTYKPGTLTADFGMVNDTNLPNLQWSGSPDNLETVTITFDATVASVDSEFITNTAVFDAGSDGTFTVSVTLIINGRVVYLPIIHNP